MSPKLDFPSFESPFTLLSPIFTTLSYELLYICPFLLLFPIKLSLEVKGIVYVSLGFFCIGGRSVLFVTISTSFKF